MKKMQRFVALASLCLMVNAEVQAQPFTREFNRTNGNIIREPLCAVQSRDGRYVASTGKGLASLTVLSFNGAGTFNWTQTIQNFRADENLLKRTSITTDGASNVITVGLTQDINGNNCLGWVIFDGSTGVMISSGGHAYPGVLKPIDVIATSDGGFAVTGQMYDNTLVTCDNHFLMKVDNSGGLTFFKKYSTYFTSDQALSGFNSIYEAANGDFILAGSDKSTGTLHPCVARIDAGGNLLWYKTYSIGSVTFTTATDVIETDDGGIIFSNETDIVTKTDAGGNVDWSRQYTALLPVGTSLVPCKWTFRNMAREFTYAEYNSFGVSGYITYITNTGTKITYYAWMRLQQSDGVNVAQYYMSSVDDSNDEPIYSMFATSDMGYLMMARTTSTGGALAVNTNADIFIDNGTCSHELGIEIDYMHVSETEYSFDPLDDPHEVTISPSLIQDAEMEPVCCPNVAVAEAVVDWPNSDCANNIFQLDVNILTGGSGSYSYQWTPGSYLNNSSIQNPISSPPSLIHYKVMITDLNTGCVTSAFVDVEPGCRGANNQSEEMFTDMAPNPASSSLSLNCNAATYSFVLRNTLGEVVMNKASLSGGRQEIDLSAVAPGVYFASFNSGNGKTITRKLVVQH